MHLPHRNSQASPLKFVTDVARNHQNICGIARNQFPHTFKFGRHWARNVWGNVERLLGLRSKLEDRAMGAGASCGDGGCLSGAGASEAVPTSHGDVNTAGQSTLPGKIGKKRKFVPGDTQAHCGTMLSVDMLTDSHDHIAGIVDKMRGTTGRPVLYINVISCLVVALTRHHPQHLQLIRLPFNTLDEIHHSCSQLFDACFESCNQGMLGGDAHLSMISAFASGELRTKAKQRFILNFQQLCWHSGAPTGHSLSAWDLVTTIPSAQGIAPYDIQAVNIFRLAVEQAWIDGDSIDAYLQLLRQDPLTDGCIQISQQYELTLWVQNESDLSGQGFVRHGKIPKRFTKLYGGIPAIGQRSDGIRYLLVPLYARRDHWALAWVDLSQTIVYHLDPWKASASKDRADELVRIINKVNRVQCFVVKTVGVADGLPQQTDGHNCGPLMLAAADCLARRVPMVDLSRMYSSKDMSKLRSAILLIFMSMGHQEQEV
jgi:hypothetical protein